MKMTKKEKRRYAYLRKYIAKVAKRLRINNHRFTISAEPPDGETNEEPTWADTFVASQTLGAKHRYGAKFWAAAPHIKTETVVHELLHSHTTPICWAMERQVKHLVPEHQWTGIEADVNHAHEIATEELARAIAPYMPRWKCKD